MKKLSMKVQPFSIVASQGIFLEAMVISLVHWGKLIFLSYTGRRAA